ncbi:MAG: helix-turn-helix domain-containing protein, partial [Burkholderiaceae bacterium]
MDMTPPPAARAAGYFWTTREETALRTTYPLGGVAAAVAAIGRSPAAIYNPAAQLGLHSPDLRGQNPGARRTRYPQHDHLDAQIRAAYAEPSRGFVCRLADRIGRPRWWVVRRAQALGIAHNRLRAPDWTRAEEALLEEKTGLGAHALALALKRAGFPPRSATAVAVRLNRIGLSVREGKLGAGLMSGNQAAALLGVMPATVCRWIEREGLPATRPRDCAPNQPFVIHERELRRWIAGHAQLINLARVDKTWF